MNNSLSVFFPCYNDEKTIGKLINDASETLKQIVNDWEIIVIDDGSKDKSRQVLRQLAKENQRLKLVFHKSNMGYGGALKSGFKKSSKKLVFYTDGDGQYDVKELKKLYKKLNASVDVVQGYKIKRHDPVYRLIIGTIYNYFSRIIFRINAKDIDCDFRLIRKKVLEGISLHYNSGVICVELIKKLQSNNARFLEVGVHHYPRKYGNSQFFNFRRVTKTLLELSRLWFNLVILKKYN